MRTTHLRHQLHLHRQKVIFSLVLVISLGIQFSAEAQKKKEFLRRHMENYEDKTLHFGFSFAAPLTRFNITHSDAFVKNDTAINLTSPVQPGFRMLFVMNTRLSKRFDFRVTPGISIYGRSVDYYTKNRTEPITELRESTWAEFPFLVKYKSERRGNTRMYVVAGVRLGVEANVRKKENPNFGRLTTKTRDVALEYGVGLERFYQFFKFAPELHFSHGIVNMLQPNSSAIGQNISKMTTHTVTLYLMFE